MFALFRTVARKVRTLTPYLRALAPKATVGYHSYVLWKKHPWSRYGLILTLGLCEGRSGIPIIVC